MSSPDLTPRIPAHTFTPQPNATYTSIADDLQGQPPVAPPPHSRIRFIEPIIATPPQFPAPTHQMPIALNSQHAEVDADEASDCEGLFVLYFHCVPRLMHLSRGSLFSVDSHEDLSGEGVREDHKAREYHSHVLRGLCHCVANLHTC